VRGAGTGAKGGAPLNESSKRSIDSGSGKARKIKRKGGKGKGTANATGREIREKTPKKNNLSKKTRTQWRGTGKDDNRFEGNKHERNITKERNLAKKREYLVKKKRECEGNKKRGKKKKTYGRRDRC